MLTEMYFIFNLCAPINNLPHSKHDKEFIALKRMNSSDKMIFSPPNSILVRVTVDLELHSGAMIIYKRTRNSHPET